MDLSRELRYFWQITVRHAYHLREMTVSPSFGAHGRRCAELRGDYGHFCHAARSAYDGTARPEFDDIEKPRRTFHEERRAECTSQLEGHAFQLPLSDRHHLNVRLSALEDETTRTLLCKAVHDTTEWQYRPPEEVADEDDLTFEVWRLETAEIETLTRLALRAACHQARLDVLDEVQRQVNGTDQYEAPAPPSGSPSEAAQEVLQSAGGRGRPSPQRNPSPAPSASPETSGDSTKTSELEDELSEVAETVEMIYDEVEGAGEQRYIGAEEAGEILGLTGKTVLNRSSFPEDKDRHIPSLTVSGSDRKRFDRKVIKRLMKASGR